jgi:hypothetical protein
MSFLLPPQFCVGGISGGDLVDELISAVFAGTDNFIAVESDIWQNPASIRLQPLPVKLS